MQQPPREPTGPGRKAREHVLRQARAEENLAHPDEERQRRQRPGVGGAPDVGGEVVADGAAGEDRHADEPGAEQRQCHPDAHTQEGQHGGHEDHAYHDQPGALEGSAHDLRDGDVEDLDGDPERKRRDQQDEMDPRRNAEALAAMGRLPRRRPHAALGAHSLISPSPPWL